MSLTKEYLTIADIYLAYKKAKADAFYENTHFHAIDFSIYEENLSENLRALHSKLTSRSPDWFDSPTFIGGYSYLPKSINPFDLNDRGHYRAIDPVEDWRQRYEKVKKKVDAKYRLVINATIDYQVVSALWILKVGHLFDEVLNQDVSFGNRLRRLSPRIGDDLRIHRPLNEESQGLFVPYFSAYRQWREYGLSAMKKSLLAGKNIVAVTMDVSGFYHNVSPEFIIRPSYLKKIKVSLSRHELIFTKQIIASMQSWYRTTPDYLERKEGALPVGLSASKIFSNVLLYEFDSVASNNIKPIYYGRYVDDIFLVMENDAGINSAEGFIRYISIKSDGLLKLIGGRGEIKELSLRLPYARDSSVIFSADKQKVFNLGSRHGIDLVDGISEQIRRQSSEYRLLPELPSDQSGMASRALLSTPDATLDADALRKADIVSIKRLGFSLLLRDVEAYAKDLDPGAWLSRRNDFYEIVLRHLMSPIGYFNYFGYFHRVFGLMISCGDFDVAARFIDRLKSVQDILLETTNIKGSNRDKIEKCQMQYSRALVQAALQASTVSGFDFSQKFTRVLNAALSVSPYPNQSFRKNKILKLSSALLYADFGRRSYKDYWQFSQTTDIKGPLVPRGFAVRRHLRLGGIRKFRATANLKRPHWPALAFSTRPLSFSEIGLVSPSAMSDPIVLKASVLALRGAKCRSKDGLGFVSSKGDADVKYFSVPNSHGQRLKIALTNIKTTEKQWRLAVEGKNDHSLMRYERLRRLVNNILSDDVRVSYVALPECSLPKRWAFSIAYKLAQNNVSFVGGLEYYEDKRKLRNDLLVSLVTRWPGYLTSVMMLQSKAKPAHGEKRSLKKLGKTLYEFVGSNYQPPIYKHGDFFFGALICSDFTSIQNREFLQGRVDAVFVPEWNSDLKTFSFLVESAAHDVHSFIIQVNNREYGDSRVRAPFEKDYRRDVVRVKGGVSDYYVIAEINYNDLRKYQKYRSPPENGAFKPWPIGYRLSQDRKPIT